MEFDLNNLEHLNQIITVVNKDPSNAHTMLSQFPFNRMGDLAVANVEVVGTITDVFSLFVHHVQHLAEYKETMIVILKFYTKTIDYHFNLDDCNFEFLEKLLKELLFGLQRVSEVPIEFTYVTLPNTLHSIAYYPDVSKNILKLALAIFITYLPNQMAPTDENFSSICTGMFKISRRFLDLVNTLKLVHVFISCFDSESYLDIKDIYNYLLSVVKLLPKLDVPLLEEAISCIIQAFQRSKDTTFRKNLAIDLAKVAFPKSIACYFLIENKIFDMHKILHSMILELFEKTPWYSVETTLHDYIIQLPTPFLLKRDPDGDADVCKEFDFLVFYLESTYRNMRPCRTQMIKNILKTFKQGLPTNPAVLKAVYFLFAANIDNELETTELHFQNGLLLSLQHLSDLEHYLTYHVAQLVWVLKYGSQILKRRVVACWAKQNDKELCSEFHRIIKATKSQHVLCDVICYETNDELLTIVMTFLKYSTVNYKKVLTGVLTRPDLTIKALSCVMKAKPMVLKLGPSDGTDFKNNLSMLYSIIPRLASIYADENISMPEKTRIELLVYLCNSCYQLVKEPEADCFITSSLVKAVSDATKSTNYFYARHAFKLLSLIVTTQVALSIKLPDQVIIEATKLVGGDPEFIICATQFYVQVLRCMPDQYSFISVEGNCLALYRNVLELLGASSFLDENIYDLLAILLDRYDECVNTMVNICAIRMNCRNLNKNPIFVKYLTLWCSHADKCLFSIPFKNIACYVKYLDSIRYNTADYRVLRTFLKIS